MNAPSWCKGTDLRSPDAKTYEWNGEKFDGLTTIRDAVWGCGDVAHGTWVAQEAQRLFALETHGMNTITSGFIRTDRGYERVTEEVKPAALFNDSDYLRVHGFRMLGRAADRGSVIHNLLYAYSQGEYLSQADVKHWVDENVAIGDGEKPYLCDLDETTGYCLSLNKWMRDTGFVPKIAECFGAHRKLGYAFTLDVIGQFPGEKWLWHIDAKSRNAVHIEDAFQLAAQWNAEFLGEPGTWNEIPMRKLLQKRFARSGVLLITPEKTVLRPLNMDGMAGLWKAWKNILSLYPYARSIAGVFDRGILAAKGAIAA